MKLLNLVHFAEDCEGNDKNDLIRNHNFKNESIKSVFQQTKKKKNQTTGSHSLSFRQLLFKLSRKLLKKKNHLTVKVIFCDKIEFHANLIDQLITIKAIDV